MVDTNKDDAYVLVDATAGSAIWKLVTEEQITEW